MSKKKIVVIGGGNGCALSIKALKYNADLFDISAVVAASDSGGSSGAIRTAFNTLPPGDIMRAVLALSKYDFSLLSQIFYKNRFSSLKETNKKLNATRGPNLGNLFLSLTAQYEGDFARAVRALEEAVEAIGHAYLSTLDQTHLVAELENGQIIRTEAAIDRPNGRDSLIKKVWLEPAVNISEDAKKVIMEADAIIFGPGSLYTSVIAAILPNGASEAIEKSKAELYHVSGRAYELKGEACPSNLSASVMALERYLPRKIDGVFYNDAELTEAARKNYAEWNWVSYNYDIENLSGRKLINEDFSRDIGGFDSEKFAPILRKYLWN